MSWIRESPQRFPCEQSQIFMLRWTRSKCTTAKSTKHIKMSMVGHNLNFPTFKGCDTSTWWILDCAIWLVAYLALYQSSASISGVGFLSFWSSWIKAKGAQPVGLHWLSPWPVSYRTCPYLRWHYAVHLDASVTSLGLVWELVKFFISLFDYQIFKIGLRAVHDDSFWWFGCITFWFVLPG